MVACRLFSLKLRPTRARPSRRASGWPTSPAPSAAAIAAWWAVGARRLPGESISHLATLFRRDLLKARPPFRSLLRSQSKLSTQQQKVVRRTEPRMLEHTQSAPASRKLQTRLERKHLTHTEREALRDCDIRLRLASGQVTGVENRRELVPPLVRG